MKLSKLLLLISALSALSAVQSFAGLKALIVDGQNNHSVWPKSTLMMREYLLHSGVFTEVDVARTKYLWKGEEHGALLPLADTGVESVFEKQPKTDPGFAPDFSRYDLVVSNFGWQAANWPPQTRAAFEKFVAGGGGFVCVHAANNSFPLWAEYNKMIGLGGWGDRTEKSGPYVYYNAAGEVVRDPSPGKAGKHAKANAFQITTRDFEHPITKGLPAIWQHTVDECYSNLRGPAENMTILATACDSEELQAAGRHEPMLMVLDYHKGRVFHTTLGHIDESFECVGWITTFQRGAQWAATGEVTIPVPADFPGPGKISTRPFALAGSNETIDLFASGDFSQWQTTQGDPVPEIWSIEDGVIHFKGGGEHKTTAANLVTRKDYDNFELTFDWKISGGGNSGVKYRTDNALGIEYQVLDDANHADGKKPTHRAGSLYDLVAAPDDKPVNPVGQWNSAKIIADGNRIEHWLNGKKVAGVELGSPDWAERFGASKYKKIEGFGTHNGPILLQDHGNEVWFRNVKIRKL